MYNIVFILMGYKFMDTGPEKDLLGSNGCPVAEKLFQQHR